MNFEFAAAHRILFGPGRAAELPRLASEYGTRALLVLGLPVERAETLFTEFTRCGLTYAIFPVAGEPTIALVRAGVQFARAQGCDVIISIGGGSAIDAGKAIAGLLANGGDPLDYLEVIGRGLPLHSPAAPFIAVPTTAGTGAEVTRNAVLASNEEQVKVSMRSPYLLPQVALVDPLLTLSLPPAVTASTGMDALTQLIEPYTSPKANPLTDGFCREGIRLAARSLHRAWATPGDVSARSDMSLASLLGGLALANAGLGAVHGFAAPLGGMYPAAHGALCAALLPHVMQANIENLRRSDPQNDALARYAEIAHWLTGDPSAKAEDGAGWVRELSAAIGIPALASVGVLPGDIPNIAAKAAAASSMKGNPARLTAPELENILARALASEEPKNLQ